jgi:cell volume regulation protein A
VTELQDFGVIVLIAAGGFLLVLMTTKVTERLPLPAPALFLVAAVVASDVWPELGDALSIKEVERIGVAALIVILFDGGMHVGWRRFRASAFPIASLGVFGTFATAAVMALFAHELFGFDWTTAGILGAALAPTDPAVMFSVLGNREVSGRTGTILEGESGANDPVGIALMIGMLEFATADDATGWTIVTEFSVEMAVGLAVGLAAAFGLRPLMQISLPNEGLYPVRVLAAAAVIYGAASVADGSGFLAVFVAGMLVGDIRAPYKTEIERFYTSLASLAEVAVFVALGLTIDVTELVDEGNWLDGLLLAILLALIARPVAVGLLLLPVRLRMGERLFVMWSGLKGAVPILLAAFAVLAGADDADRIYQIVFVVVLFSVVVQGSTIGVAARRLGVPMRYREAEPWDLSIRLRDEPKNLHRFVVADGARAAGVQIRELRLGESAWIALVIREGEAQQARGSAVVQPGDELLVLADERDAPALKRYFEGAASGS